MTIESLPLIVTALGSVVIAVLAALGYNRKEAGQISATAGQDVERMKMLRDETQDALDRCTAERDVARKTERELRKEIKELLNGR